MRRVSYTASNPPFVNPFATAVFSLFAKLGFANLCKYNNPGIRGFNALAVALIVEFGVSETLTRSAILQPATWPWNARARQAWGVLECEG